MKNFTRKFIVCALTFLMGVGLVAPAFNTAPTQAISAGESTTSTFGVETAILTGCAAVANADNPNGDGGTGAGILCVVRTAADILSVLIAIVGIIGIVVVGVQYLSAGGNEEKVRIAKRRLFEIIIGLVLYGVAYFFANWLLPNYDATVKKSESAASVITSIGA